jgi:alkanesulfonate monooxygenase SsuD/methylene tetrahydromethanopterin reductase-like flavin-dependent oxidoreductase (luciferase family)
MAPSPSVYLSAVASRTGRLRFGPLVYLLPFYHPVRLVEEVCMLDQMSGGRLMVGVGRGVSPFESGFFGVNNSESEFRFAEALEVLVKGLTSDRLVHRGELYKIYNVPMELKPKQLPYPPLWYGLGSERGATTPARWGMNVVMLGPTDHLARVARRYREAWDEHRGAPERAASPVKEPLIGASRHIVVAETEAEAVRIGKPAYERWYRSLTTLAGSFGFRQLNAVGDFEAARREGTVVAGTPAMVRDALAQQVAAIGVNYLVGQLAFGDMTHAEELRNLALFAAEVMPRLTLTVA